MPTEVLAGPTAGRRWAGSRSLPEREEREARQTPSTPARDLLGIWLTLEQHRFKLKKNRRVNGLAQFRPCVQGSAYLQPEAGNPRMRKADRSYTRIFSSAGVGHPNL